MTRRTALAMAGAYAVRAGDWVALFDGRSFAGWTLGDGSEVTHSWTIEDRAISTVAATRGRSDLLYTKPLRSFELAFEFRLSKGSNTGVKYFVLHALRYLYPGSGLSGSYGAIGLEFQLADDDAPDVSQPAQKLGALYGILPAQEAVRYKVGDWASARLICRNRRCEHWINGKPVLVYDPGAAELRRKLQSMATDPAHSIVGAAAAQVFARREAGDMPPALIALQQHNSKAWFRGLQVRELND
jgi:hypothetical protein